MKHGDFEEPLELPQGVKLIKGSDLWKHPEVRCVTCPNGELIFLHPIDLDGAYDDLSTWALIVSNEVLNQ